MQVRLVVYNGNGTTGSSTRRTMNLTQAHVDWPDEQPTRRRGGRIYSLRKDVEHLVAYASPEGLPPQREPRRELACTAKARA